MFVVLDFEDKNWMEYFTEEEMKELKVYCGEIEYPNLPADMQSYLNNIPETDDLNQIFHFTKSTIIDIDKEPQLYWLKSSIQSAISLLKSKYLPLSDQKERDICNRVWHFVGAAFDSSKLKFRTELQSIASQRIANKKRKIAANVAMEKQLPGLIPDMIMSFEELEYGIAEAAKSCNNTKEMNEGGKFGID